MLDKEQLKQLGRNFGLTTARLNLRLFRPQDQADEVRQQQDPQVVRFIREPLTDEQAEAFFEQFTKPYEAKVDEWLGICVERLEQPCNIGAISFKIHCDKSAVFEIGYRFNPEFQGQGYAFEAVSNMVQWLFDVAKAHKVMALCDPENHPSYKLMEKLNMQREGCLRQHFKLGQQWRDVYVYGLLQNEFNAS